ncbi:MAG: S41 family peptidase, partial [Stellaceae bacterium]
MMRFRHIAASAAILVWLLAPAAQSADAPPTPAPKHDADTYRELDLFGEVFERVRADYVDKVSDEHLIEAAINGMLSSLDPHSSYMNAKDFAEMQV